MLDRVYDILLVLYIRLGYNIFQPASTLIHARLTFFPRPCIGGHRLCGFIVFCLLQYGRPQLYGQPLTRFFESHLLYVRSEKALGLAPRPFHSHPQEATIHLPRLTVDF